MAKKIEIELSDEAYEELERVAPAKDKRSIANLVYDLLVCSNCRGIQRWCRCDNDE